MNDDLEFFDTNVIAYAFDVNEHKKRQIAAQLLLEVSREKRKGVISNQILFELFLILTRKLKKPLTKIEAINMVLGFIKSDQWRKVDYSHRTIEYALDLVHKHNTSFVDAVIASTALENGVTKIYTENEKDFKKISGIKVINPFRK